MQGNNLLLSIIDAVNEYGRFFCKFISANDVGINGAHQEGIYLNKSSWDMFFERPEPSSGILDRIVKIHIDNYKPFDSRVVYYTSKNEFRITRFWRNTPFDKNEAVGALIIFIPISNDDYMVYLLNTDEEIESFTDRFSLSLVKNFAVFDNTKTTQDVKESLEDRIKRIVSGYQEFPVTSVMAEISRNVHKEFNKRKYLLPDTDILEWIDMEYAVFRAIEKEVYKEKLLKPFYDMEPLLKFASSAMNRRKSRAGKSLEHHLNFIFRTCKLPFDNPGKTEAKRRPDFLFPSSQNYQDPDFPAENLIMLGAKTTCKDRWRQVLFEAGRIRNKHLITLQQGISMSQMDEMKEGNLTLVVPKPLHKFYPKDYQSQLWTLQKFIEYAKEKYTI